MMMMTMMMRATTMIMKITTNIIITTIATIIYRKWVLRMQVSIEAFAAYVEDRAGKGSLSLLT